MRITPGGLGFLLLIGVTPGWALGGVCQCVDRGDIELRLREAREAARVYREQIEVIRAQERRTGQVVDWTEARYLELKGYVQDALTEVARSSGRFSTLAVGKTTPWPDCAAEVLHPAASPCIKQAIYVHEAVHQKACTFYNRWTMTLIRYAEEEIASYEAENAFLEKELKGLRCGYRFETGESFWPPSTVCPGGSGLRFAGGVCGEPNDPKAEWWVTYRYTRCAMPGSVSEPFRGTKAEFDRGGWGPLRDVDAVSTMVAPDLGGSADADRPM
jgi:hypothetical protein